MKQKTEIIKKNWLNFDEIATNKSRCNFSHILFHFIWPEIVLWTGNQRLQICNCCCGWVFNIVIFFVITFFKFCFLDTKENCIGIKNFSLLFFDWISIQPARVAKNVRHAAAVQWYHKQNKYNYLAESQQFVRHWMKYVNCVTFRVTQFRFE